VSPWLATAAVYATQLAAGRVVLALAGGAPRHGRAEGLARVLLYGPLALGVQLFVYHLAAVPHHLPLVLPPWWLALGALALRGGLGRPAAVERSRAERAVLAAAAGLFALALVQGGAVPVYRGDEVNNFALNARVFELHASLAPDALMALADPGHPEYPPLIALNEALVFRAAGEARTFAVKPFFALAYLAFALLAAEACFRRLRPALAAPLALVVLALPEVNAYAAGGMADLRLAACVLLLALETDGAFRRPSRRALAGFVLAAGACAWTKNEGIAVATLAALGLAACPRRGGVSARGLAAGAAAVLVLAWSWPAFKAAHGLRDVYLSGAVREDPLANLDRLGAIASAFAGFPLHAELHGHPSWGVLWPLAGLAAAAALLRGGARRELIVPLALLALHLGVYAAVFVVTPRPLEWHLATAGPRLFFHATPWVLAVLIASARVLDRVAEPGAP